MSDIVGKTWTSLQSFISGSSDAAAAGNSLSTQRWESQWSRKFAAFVNELNSIESKEEESKLIAKMSVMLKQSLSNPKIKPIETKECIAEAIICELLGYPAPFIYIHAIKLADHNVFHIKRMGYLAVSCFLHSKHELILLMINTLQKDLQSKNVLEICLALSLVCEVVDEDHIAAVLPLVEQRLTHSNPNVRKKAASCIESLANKSMKTVLHIAPKLLKQLTDPDPSVMIAVLQSLIPFIQADPSSYKHLLPNLIKVQEQIVHRKMPKDLNYNTVPAPWCQIMLLKIFRIFGQNDQSCSKMMEVTLKKTIMQSDINENIAFGIVCECIETIASIESSAELTTMCLTSITALLKSHNANLKYMGLEALTTMVTKIKNFFDSQHQPAVVECLHHPDISIRLKTLDLLYYLCNKQNVVVICEQFFEFLNHCQDAHQQDNLVNKMFDLADRYHPSFSWYINTVNQLFDTGFVSCNSSVMKTVLKNLKKANYENIDEQVWDEITKNFFKEACESEKIQWNSCKVQLVIWLLQECKSQLKTVTEEDKNTFLCNILQKNNYNEDIVVSLLSFALQFVLESQSNSSAQLLDVIKAYQNHSHFFISQLAEEIQSCCDVMSELKSQGLQARLFSNEQLEVDPFLSHQDEYVIEALENGAKPYCHKGLIPSPMPNDMFHKMSLELDTAKQSSKSSSLKSGADNTSISSGSFSLARCDKETRKQYQWTKEGLKVNVENNPELELQLDSAEDNSEQLAQTDKGQLETSLFAGVGSN